MYSKLASIALAALLAAAVIQTTRAGAQSCEDEVFDNTFDAIQELIFEARGCTNAVCHAGPKPAGGLDLSPGVAYDNLLDQPVQSVSTGGNPGLRRLVPGSKGNSLLWINLASAVIPDQWQAPLNSMPIGLPPISFDELELLREWIENGATREGVVPGTEDLVDACFAEPRPLKVEPLQPPAAGKGVQLRAPQQVLPPDGERETCFVSYYDFTGQIPDESLADDGQTFRFKRVEARQDPLSHHAVVIVYNGNARIDDPIWGPFACRGGERSGESCDPVEAGACGNDGICGSPPMNSVACIGFGPGDAGIGVAQDSLFSTMASNVAEQEGVFAEAPIKGILVWNSHAFNLTNESALLDIWVNLEFALQDEQRHPLQRVIDISRIFDPSAPAYGADQLCQHFVMPDGARVLDLTSHTHKRGKRFQIWEGRFECDVERGHPNFGDPCTPFGPEPGFPLEDLCGGAACSSILLPEIGDCNGDMVVTIAELIVGVNQALGLATQPCARFDPEGDGVTIGDLVRAVRAALNPGRSRDPEESLIYTNLTYADPLVLQFKPSHSFAPRGSSARERTLTYCALYDNGFSDPAEVKRNSLSLNSSARCSPTHCAEGRVGEPCTGSGSTSRNRSCDSSSGAGDGFCDACTADFGVTTEDEMFVLIGSYFLE